MEKLLIAHRGNINGRIAEKENDPRYVREALSLGYDAEIDVWYIDGQLYSGHDNPRYKIEYVFLIDPRLWIHCKNLEAMEFLSGKGLNAFAHDDDIIITPNGYLWTAPGFPITKRSIAVMPELANDWDISLAYGICTDFPIRYDM